MTDARLTALSPLDGRYAHHLGELADYFSEAALIRYRIRVEALWFRHLAAEPTVGRPGPLSHGVLEELDRLASESGLDAARRVKDIESRTNHDVKAVEYLVRERLAAAGATPAQLEYVHFACTSEDINNLSYALMLRDARAQVLQPLMRRLAAALRSLAHDQAAVPMLSRTHGQPASPTTLGKEMANFLARLESLASRFDAVGVLGKMNGAVGNFNAHVAAFPEADWPEVARRFVESLGVAYNPYTIQIEPHDWTAEYCDALARYDTALIDFCRDVWGYVSLGYFRQRTVSGEVGSSTMPHKVNPIDFENAEGNAGLANALLRFMSDKLPLSRWQRDLTDSTVQRNLGVALGHVVLALRSVLRGVAKLEPDPERMAVDLDANWEVLAEAIQTVMRRYGVTDAYERLKDFTRGRRVGPAELRVFVAGLDLPPDVAARLGSLTPADYTGLAEALARGA
ncbi:MAG: adenylosuccinate lyase [Gammaproteobacteria bacterium SG8_30]|nr:MAG: adenylosuccinate lyase [Gammaproteobacteria bacterium SG8_30]